MESNQLRRRITVLETRFLSDVDVDFRIWKFDIRPFGFNESLECLQHTKFARGERIRREEDDIWDTI